MKIAAILAMVFVMEASCFSIPVLRSTSNAVALGNRQSMRDTSRCVAMSAVKENAFKASMDASKAALMSVLLASTLALPNLAPSFVANAAAPTPEVNDIENFKVLKVKICFNFCC
jgi:hypothetical protein